MALFLSLFVLSMFHFTNNANTIPSQGYMRSSKIKSVDNFLDKFEILWGSNHQNLDDRGTLTINLDSNSGGGFKSLDPYASGYFGAKMKLPDKDYTAGIDISFYLSNDEQYKGWHDEVDIEFLGNIEGKPYVLQTNVFIKGSGDGDKPVGREMAFELWFDPKKVYATYAIVYTPAEIIWFVNNIPIRRYPKYSDETFPMRPMWVYGSIWDASEWATAGGKYKANYAYQPFIAKYKDFKIVGCKAAQPNCKKKYPFRSGLSPKQYQIMMIAQKHHMIYNYCNSSSRDPNLTPECQS
ncbi:hypothetical protein CASFOL_032836 [Castilleja foliolosa]|uniref:Xyloglucan endotransglucosylase/hydrolase n=1 Tax=Castilleja foliolosa TaxID=1961234 RepID=A0ABD3C2M4_9LAMI